MEAQTGRESDERATAYRRRLLEGLAEAIRQKGYVGASVADVVRHARTSRRTFYEQFADLNECYVALMLQENARIITTTAGAVDADAAWETQVEQAVTAWSHAAVADPALVRSWIRELGGLGEAGRDLQRQLLASFGDMVTGLIEGAAANGLDIAPPSRHVLILLLGGLRELLATAFEDGDSADDVARSATEVTIAVLELGRTRARS